LFITVPLIGRRRWPLACLAVQFAGLLPADIGVNAATLAALLIGAYSLAVYGRSVLLSMGALLAAAAVPAGVKSNTWPPLPERAGAFAILLPIGLFGIAIRAARSRAHASAQRAQALEREQQAPPRLAVAQEQARIARELHDVVSHHVSVMTIQGGAAGKGLSADPEQSRRTPIVIMSIAPGSPAPLPGGRGGVDQRPSPRPRGSQRHRHHDPAVDPAPLGGLGHQWGGCVGDRGDQRRA